MPFFDDSGIVRENHRGPIIGGFAAFGEQVERLVAVNVGWALTLFPALLALAITNAPTWIRIGLLAASSLLVVPATGVLYALVAIVVDGEQVTWATVIETIRERALGSVAALTPLFAGMGVLVWTTVLSARAELLVVEVVLRVAVLFALVPAIFFGAVHASHPSLSALALVRSSAQLLWRHPGATLKVAAMSGAVLTFGAITVAGAVLAAVVVVALMQTLLVTELREAS